ncbi:hypothetical protein ACFO3D_11545 [Virgibacillus kekensis]|uniref:Uncharacterized protein n=1 Tax=Virgibacillus kekensis TaxID=202261 RepID=A0ABV9DJ07_9BACI
MIHIQDKRIATIVEEIGYWKEHKLLPDMYCDFLLALYTNGEYSEEPQKGKISRIALVNLVQLTMLFLLLPFSFVTIYLTEFHFILQSGFLILFALYAFWMSRTYRVKRSKVYHLALLIHLLLILLLCVHISTALVLEQGIQIALILVNMVFWYFLGQKYRINYLRIVSGISVLFVILYTVL